MRGPAITNNHTGNSQMTTKKQHASTVSYKNSNRCHSEHHQYYHREIDVLSPAALLGLIGLYQVLSCLCDVAICAKYFFADDLYLLALLLCQFCCLLENVVDIHDAFGHHVDFLVSLVHQFPLHLKLHLLLSLALSSLFTLFVREPVPGGSIAARWLLLQLERGRRVCPSLWNDSVIVVCR